jgi:hypothetical protein
VISCQSQNYSTEHPEFFAPLPSRLNDKTWQAMRREILYVAHQLLRSGLVSSLQHLRIALPAIDGH